MLLASLLLTLVSSLGDISTATLIRPPSIPAQWRWSGPWLDSRVSPELHGSTWAAGCNFVKLHWVMDASLLTVFSPEKQQKQQTIVNCQDCSKDPRAQVSQKKGLYSGRYQKKELKKTSCPERQRPKLKTPFKKDWQKIQTGTLVAGTLRSSEAGSSV